MQQVLGPINTYMIVQAMVQLSLQPICPGIFSEENMPDTALIVAVVAAVAAVAVAAVLGAVLGAAADNIINLIEFDLTV